MKFRNNLKKRGRKPKEKVYSIDQKILHKKPKEYNILFIPIHSNDINTDDELMTEQVLRYNPDINIPKPYEPNYNKNFSMCEETISKNSDTEQLSFGEELNFDKNDIVGVDIQNINFTNSINNEDGLLLTSKDYEKIKESQLNMQHQTDDDIMMYNKKTIYKMLPEFYDANSKNEWPQKQMLDVGGVLYLLIMFHVDYLIII